METIKIKASDLKRLAYFCRVDLDCIKIREGKSFPKFDQQLYALALQIERSTDDEFEILNNR